MTEISLERGPGDRLTDIAGLSVGQAVDATARTGVTVILPERAAVMAVDVRGGAPGTRDTDALDPTCLINAFHGCALSGGSVFGLGAADGVAAWLARQGRGLPFGPVPIPVVPAAILFDMMNGGDKNWGNNPPFHRLGIEACECAGAEVEEGRVGAAFGAVAGDRKGGVGTASAVCPDGFSVAAIVAVNSFGPPMSGAGDENTIPMPKLGLIGGNTTIGLVATDLALDKAGAKRLAIMAQDGLARRLRPVHTPFDGDTVFAMATGTCEAGEPIARTLAIAGTMAADCIARAIDKGLAAAAD